MRYPTKLLQPISMLILMVAFALQGAPAVGQIDITWTGAGDGSTFSDDANWNPSVGTQGPDFGFFDDSLKFDSAGTTIENDLDPATNGDVALQLGPGSGNEATSAAFHFLPGSGNFTFTGFEVTAGNSGQNGVFRAEAGAGLLQTFDIPIKLTGGNKRRKVVMGNEGTVVFNGDVNFTNSVMFVDEVAGRVELNGNNTGVGPGLVSGGTNGSRAVLRNNIANTVLHLGSDTALGDAGTGTWDAGDLQMRGLTSNKILFLESDADRDLSNYLFNLADASGGGAIRFNSASDMSIGYLMRAGNGTRVASLTNESVLTIEQGIFLSPDDQARDMGLFSGGTAGNVAGGNGHIVINGRLHTTLIDPATAIANGTSATGGILPGLPDDVVPGKQFLAVDGVTPVNGSIQARYGTFTLNGDSSTTWVGAQFIANNGSTVFVGNDDAFGDSESIVVVNGGATVDIGTQTIGQRFYLPGGGTVRGNGRLTYEGDWSIAGAIQPGGESPSANDTLTFDFSGAAVSNTLQFELDSTAVFTLDAGMQSSTVEVVGSLGGTTSVVLDDNLFAFTDLTAGSLAAGDYTLIEGDANTSFDLGVGVGLVGLDSYPGSVLSVSGNDLILTLQGVSGGSGDFNNDGAYDCADIDALVAEIASAGNTPSFDLNGDGSVTLVDLQDWLAEAGEANIGPGRSYLAADANLDGVVDTSDFNVWNANKFTAVSAWCSGDFNADGVVDTSDFNIWNANKFTASDAAAVPEPNAIVLLLVGFGAIFSLRRNRCKR
jgi:hypothetical protein